MGFSCHSVWVRFGSDALPLGDLLSLVKLIWRIYESSPKVPNPKFALPGWVSASPSFHVALVHERS
jgi:hypothetical protein